MVSRSRTEIDAEPLTRSSAALAADLFNASAKDFGETGLVTVWFRSLAHHYALFASKAKGLMPPRYVCRLRVL